MSIACLRPTSSVSLKPVQMSSVSFPDIGSGSFRDAYQRIEESLGNADASTQRDEIKAEIIALFRAVDREIGELTGLKEEIKGLVERWKMLAGEESSASPGAAPPTRTDHLNASTFV